MSNIPWEDLKPVIETGHETQKIELKERIGCSSRAERADFARMTTAMANTGGETGYIIVGVVDARRRTPDSTAWLRGFQVENPDEFERQMIEAIGHFIEPPFEVRYQQVYYPETTIYLGVLTIPASSHRPHVVKNDGEGIYKGQIFVRRGTQITLASREEIIEMCGDHWRRLMEDYQRNLGAMYHGVDREAVDFKRIAESACRRLYHTLPKIKRDKVVKEILATFEREGLFQEWFEEE